MSDRLTDEQIAELERLALAATPGEWSDTNEYGVESVVSDEGLSVATADLRDESLDEHTRACTDMAFIAAARNALPSLLAELRERRAAPSPVSVTRGDRLNWQCSGCGWGFKGPWQKTCPACGRIDYWCGSVSPEAKEWPGVSVPREGAAKGDAK